MQLKRDIELEKELKIGVIEHVNPLRRIEIIWDNGTAIYVYFDPKFPQDKSIRVPRTNHYEYPEAKRYSAILAYAVALAEQLEAE